MPSAARTKPDYTGLFKLPPTAASRSRSRLRPLVGLANLIAQSAADVRHIEINPESDRLLGYQCLPRWSASLGPGAEGDDRRVSLDEPRRAQSMVKHVVALPRPPHSN
jgi:hypothetical protein